MRKSFKPTVFFAYLLLIIGSLVMVFPFLWMILSSFKDAREIFQFGFWPKQWLLSNYHEVIFDTDFPRWFLNSLIVATLTTTSVLFFCSLVGYTLAKLRFAGKQLIFVLILSTLMVPTEMLVIPWFVMSAEYRWVDTFWGIAFPGMITGFGVFLMRQFFESLPQDLFDAGRIDGVNEFGLFWRIGLPLVQPALAALGIFSFIGNWN
ncbi:MAG: carbohydrate ABC transporter permease, partial [Deinococcales bacterium]